MSVYIDDAGKDKSLTWVSSSAEDPRCLHRHNLLSWDEVNDRIGVSAIDVERGHCTEFVPDGLGGVSVSRGARGVWVGITSHF